MPEQSKVLEYDELETAIQGCDRVFHLAALVSFHPSDEQKLMCINKGGTENVVNAMLMGGIKKLVYVSSVAAFGHTTKSPITEETPFEEGPLITGYSRSKYASELEVWRGHAEGLDVLIVNPTIIIGEGNFSRSSGELLRYFPKDFLGDSLQYYLRDVLQRPPQKNVHREVF